MSQIHSRRLFGPTQILNTGYVQVGPVPAGKRWSIKQVIVISQTATSRAFFTWATAGGAIRWFDTAAGLISNVPTWLVLEAGETVWVTNGVAGGIGFVQLTGFEFDL